MSDVDYEELGLPSREALQRGGPRVRALAAGPRGRVPSLMTLAARALRSPLLPACPPVLLPHVLVEVILRDDAPMLAKMLSTWPLETLDLRPLRLYGKRLHGYVTLALNALLLREVQHTTRVDLRGLDCTVPVLNALLNCPADAASRVVARVDLRITPLSFKLLSDLASRDPALRQLSVSQLSLNHDWHGSPLVILSAASSAVVAELRGMVCEVDERALLQAQVNWLAAVTHAAERLVIRWTGSKPVFGDEPLVLPPSIRHLELAYCSGVRLPEFLASLANLQVLILSYMAVSSQTFSRALEALAPRALRHLTIRSGLEQVPPELLSSLAAGLAGSRESLRSLIVSFMFCPSPVELLCALLPLPQLTHLAVRKCVFCRKTDEDEAPAVVFARLLRQHAPRLEYLSLVGADLHDASVDDLLEGLGADRRDCKLRLLDLRDVRQAEPWLPKCRTPYGRLQVVLGYGTI